MRFFSKLIDFCIIKFSDYLRFRSKVQLSSTVSFSMNHSSGNIPEGNLKSLFAPVSSSHVKTGNFVNVTVL